MLQRGVAVEHSTINRWVLKYTPQLGQKAVAFGDLLQAA
jgi:transposase-like protein